MAKGAGWKTRLAVTVSSSGLGALLFLGLVFSWVPLIGLLPARWAARMEIVEALRQQ